MPNVLASLILIEVIWSFHAGCLLSIIPYNLVQFFFSRLILCVLKYEVSNPKHNVSTEMQQILSVSCFLDFPQTCTTKRLYFGGWSFISCEGAGRQFCVKNRHFETSPPHFLSFLNLTPHTKPAIQKWPPTTTTTAPIKL